MLLHYAGEQVSDIFYTLTVPDLDVNTSATNALAEV
jgi:hypothetical protein